MSQETQPAPALTKGQIFVRRLTSTVILWAVVLGGLFSGTKLLADYLFLAFMVFLASFGLAEFYGLVEKKNFICFKRLGIFGGILLMVGTNFHFQGLLGISG